MWERLIKCITKNGCSKKDGFYAELAPNCRSISKLRVKTLHPFCCKSNKSDEMGGIVSPSTSYYGSFEKRGRDRHFKVSKSQESWTVMESLDSEFQKMSETRRVFIQMCISTLNNSGWSFRIGGETEWKKSIQASWTGSSVSLDPDYQPLWYDILKITV